MGFVEKKIGHLVQPFFSVSFQIEFSILAYGFERLIKKILDAADKLDDQDFNKTLMTADQI
jgi:hypothetical protein